MGENTDRLVEVAMLAGIPVRLGELREVLLREHQWRVREGLV